MTIDARALRDALPELAPTLRLDWKPVDERQVTAPAVDSRLLRVERGAAGATVRIEGGEELAPWVAPIRGRYVESWQDERARTLDVGLPDEGSVVAVFSGDQGVVLERADDTLLVCGIELNLKAPPRPMVEGWLSAQDDGGVRFRAQEWLNKNRPWDRLSAAALLAWCNRDASTADGIAEWIADCDVGDHQRLSALVIGEADGLSSRLRRLGDDDEFRPYDEHWQAAFHGCRRLRARLGGLAWWLSQSGDVSINERVAATLASTDRLGIEALSESMDSGPAEPWLQTLHTLAPYSWWATPTSPDLPFELPDGWN